MPSDNINMLQTVARGLGDLRNEMVLVGGVVAELYADDPASSNIRPTLDVDCTIELQWYPGGVGNKISKTLPDGTEIFVFPPEYYLAAKFEAHNDRGGTDLRQSHDFEDIVYLLDNCTSILENIRNSDEDVKGYLKDECKKLLDNIGLSEGIECALPMGSDSDRVEIIETLITDISELA